jgi:subtilisin family serine protease
LKKIKFSCWSMRPSVDNNFISGLYYGYNVLISAPVFNRIISIILLTWMIQGIWAQETLISDQLLRKRQQENRELRPDDARRVAVEYARRNNLPERVKYRDGTVLEIKKLSPTGQPMYYKTFNMNAARTISSDQVWEDGSSGLDLNGNGIVVGLWDAGLVRTTHDEFGGRARIFDSSAEIDFHTTHVAGTIGAAGVISNAHGMANLSTIDSYDWENDNQEIRNAAGQGLLISNHSYGFVQGWDYNQEKERWEWWGDVGISEKEDYNFGFYGSEAMEWDDIAVDHPRILMVKSAGNDRGEGPAPGASHYVYVEGSWRQSNAVRDLDGGSDGYDCVDTQGTSKNILTVGAVDDIPGGYKTPSDVKLADFSAIGPTNDGRIKPDLVANGVSLYSTTDESDQSYGYSSGTSMSSPSVAGSLALLQQHYHALYGEFMYSSQLKALVIHTADEAGKEGPDYRNGWGVINPASAARVITRGTREQFFYDDLENQEVKEYTFFCRGEEEIRITLVWTDQSGVVPAAQLNPVNRMLVNDLDIRLTRNVDEILFRPYVLDPANPSGEAQTGDNIIDNVEQIRIAQPMAGFYTLVLSHKSSLQGGEIQPYSLVINGLNKDYIASGSNILEEANGAILLTSADQYPDNMDVSWLIQPGNGHPVSFYFDFFETETVNDILTIYDGADTTAAVIAQFSGILGTGDTLVNATSDEMFVTFTSDDQNTARGFRAKYCTVAPEGEYTITGAPYPCEFALSPYFTLGQEGADFSWVSSEGWSFEQKSINGIDLAVGEQDGTLSVRPYNRCGDGGEAVISIQPQNSAPLIEYVTGDSITCAGWSSMLTVNAVPGVTYHWSLPASWAGASESDTLFFIPAAETDLVSVSGTNACGQGNEINIQVVVLDVPDRPGILTEKAPPCAYTVQDFYVTPTAGTRYLWEVQDDWKIIGDANMDKVTVAIGAVESFLSLTAINQCGEKKGSRLFLTSPVPAAANVIMNNGPFGLPELQVTNLDEFESIRWYRNGEPVTGGSGTSGTLVANLNGLYGAESISEEGCRNPGGESDIVRVDRDNLAFLAYRVDETTIIIENTTAQTADFRIVTVAGQVVMAGKAEPGHNEIPFLGNGIYLIRFSENGVEQNYKALF